FLQWFTGFTDVPPGPEGSFIISLPKKSNQVHFIFKITLHIDDINVLHIIKNKLKIDNIYCFKHTASFQVHSFKEILELVIIFNKYHLLTHKQLDYRDWKKAIELKQKYLIY
ncbi:hypothetical protein K439DRAFT_1321906, partial [Ramaria rubella]